MLESTATVNLADLPRNQSATIIDYCGDANVAHRLEEMGLQRGLQVEMIRPGSPCTVAINGRRMSLRLEKLDIFVDPLPLLEAITG
jgi:ferrous iron transport protein A